MCSFICPFNLLIHNGIAHFLPEKSLLFLLLSAFSVEAAGPAGLQIWQDGRFGCALKLISRKM